MNMKEAHKFATKLPSPQTLYLPANEEKEKGQVEIQGRYLKGTTKNSNNITTTDTIIINYSFTLPPEGC